MATFFFFLLSNIHIIYEVNMFFYYRKAEKKLLKFKIVLLIPVIFKSL